ncbi:hypothetical protein [Allonocardiopsis opalescens]|uniref:Uncharacterized protein n=1 Tax=Allonocardiopsis opalescens TaxID=1144618 RepID=A0A2T0Q4H4_9ACTN|nr:hypothetical protein [Allonocardiopsis opalescens]PRX98706.1 hypothetical protein CLV72_104285 [Allonocardiopsis opalescens]
MAGSISPARAVVLIAVTSVLLGALVAGVRLLAGAGVADAVLAGLLMAFAHAAAWLAVHRWRRGPDGR